MRFASILLLLASASCIEPPPEEIPQTGSDADTVDTAPSVADTGRDAAAPDVGVDMSPSPDTGDVGQADQGAPVDIGPDLPPPNVVQEVEPNDAYGDGELLVPGDHFAGTRDLDTADWFRVEVSDAPCLLTIGGVDPVPGEMSVAVRIYSDETGVTQRAYRTQDGPERSLFVGSDQTLYIRVGPSDQMASYEFSTERRDLPEPTLLSSDSVLAKLDGYEPDLWKLEVSAETSFTASMQRDLLRDSEIDPYLMVFDPATESIVVADDDISTTDENSSVGFAAAAGTYWIVATGWNIPAASDYILEVKPAP